MECRELRPAAAFPALMRDSKTGKFPGSMDNYVSRRMLPMISMW